MERNDSPIEATKRWFLKGLGGLAGGALVSRSALAHEQPYTRLGEVDGTDEEVETLVDAMTLEEKINRLHNHFGPLPDFSTGYMAPLNRLNIPGFTMADGPVGVRHPFFVDKPNPRNFDDVAEDEFTLFVNSLSLSGGPSTAFPSTISLDSTWDTDRMNEFGTALASEAKAKDQDVLLAPGLNIARVPELGRNFEYFGEDPYLTSRGGVAVIEGIQSMGVVADAKHFVANNQEANRMSMSSQVSERALREIYLPAFKAAVKEVEVGSVMAAYNRVNGTYCTEHERLLTDVLRDEWGFEGFVVSDWGAINDAAAAANAGTDWDGHIRQVQEEYFGEKLQAAVESGEVSEARIDEMVTRVLQQSKRFGVLEGDQEGPVGEANTPEHQQLAREIAAEGGVLLKNDDPGLPLDLKETNTIAVIGPDAAEAKTGGGGSSNITTPPGSEVSPVEGIQHRAGADAVVTHSSGDATADAVALASVADVAIVVATGDSTEQMDRSSIQLPYDQNELIADVADANEHTVVVLRTGGPVVMPWLDSVSAVLEMWYPGMKDGLATADLLFGDVNPSGKLPLTFGKSREDYPASEAEAYPGVDEGDGYPVAKYTEGIYVGYRWFDKHEIEPLFPFGHGLSYTEFTHENIDVSPAAMTPGQETVTVSVEVSNSGERTGPEMVQAYVADRAASIDRPPKELAAFEKVTLDPGETETIELEIEADDLAYYDVDGEEWVVEEGTFDVLVGSSSRDIRQWDTFRMADELR